MISKISEEIQTMIQEHQGTEKKIPVIITLKTLTQDIVEKIQKYNIIIDRSFSEPISLITCNAPLEIISDLVKLDEIKKIEYDGEMYTQ